MDGFAFGAQRSQIFTRVSGVGEGASEDLIVASEFKPSERSVYHYFPRHNVYWRLLLTSTVSRNFSPSFWTYKGKTHNIHYFLSSFLSFVLCAHSYLGRCYCNWLGTGSTNLEHNEGLSTCASKNCTDNSKKYRCEYPNSGDTWLTCSGLSPTWHKQNQRKCGLHGCCLKTICIGLVMKQPFIVKV